MTASLSLSPLSLAHMHAQGWSYSKTRPNLPRDTYPALVAHMDVVIYNGDW